LQLVDLLCIPSPQALLHFDQSPVDHLYSILTSFFAMLGPHLP